MTRPSTPITRHSLDDIPDELDLIVASSSFSVVDSPILEREGSNLTQDYWELVGGTPDPRLWDSDNGEHSSL